MSTQPVKEQKAQVAVGGKPRVFIGGLKLDVKEEDIAVFLTSFGAQQVEIIRNADKQCKGFGYVTLRDAEAVKACVKSLNKTKWQGQLLRVEAAKPDYMSKLHAKWTQEEAKAKEEQEQLERRRRRQALEQAAQAPTTTGVAKWAPGVPQRWVKVKNPERMIAIMTLKKPDGSIYEYNPAEEKFRYQLIHDYARTVRPEDVVWTVDERQVEQMKQKARQSSLEEKSTKKRKREPTVDSEGYMDDAGSDSSLDEMIASTSKRRAVQDPTQDPALAKHLQLDDEFEVASPNDIKKVKELRKVQLRADEKVPDFASKQAYKHESDTSMSVLSQLFGDSVRSYKSAKAIPASLLAIESGEESEEDISPPPPNGNGDAHGDVVMAEADDVEEPEAETHLSTVAEIDSDSTWSLGTASSSMKGSAQKGKAPSGSSRSASSSDSEALVNSPTKAPNGVPSSLDSSSSSGSDSSSSDSEVQPSKQIKGKPAPATAKAKFSSSSSSSSSDSSDSSSSSEEGAPAVVPSKSSKPTKAKAKSSSSSTSSSSSDSSEDTPAAKLPPPQISRAKNASSSSSSTSSSDSSDSSDSSSEEAAPAKKSSTSSSSSDSDSSDSSDSSSEEDAPAKKSSSSSSSDSDSSDSSDSDESSSSAVKAHLPSIAPVPFQSNEPLPFQVQVSNENSDIGKSLFGQQAGVVFSTMGTFSLTGGASTAAVAPSPFQTTASQAPWLLRSIPTPATAESKTDAVGEPKYPALDAQEKAQKLKRLEQPLFPYLTQEQDPEWIANGATFMRSKPMEEIQTTWKSQRKSLLRDSKKKHKYAAKRGRLVHNGD